MKQSKLINTTVIFCIMWCLTIKAQPVGVDVIEVANGFFQSVGVTSANDNSQRLFVVEQGGTIQVVKNGQVNDVPMIDIDPLVQSGGERGLLGLAFHPDHANNGYFFVFYSNNEGDNELVRYSISNNNPDVADPNSAFKILKVTGLAGNHNGGDLHFGPDGFLYLSTGDGGFSIFESQNNNSLLGKILRIDIDGDDFPNDTDINYVIPNDNPHGNAMWVKGFRNPWRFSIDRLNGDLFIGDVGEDRWEEFNLLESGSAGGQNYGWPCFENNEAFFTNDATCQAITNQVEPIAALEHDIQGSNNCSAMGGFRYRGNDYPGLYGWYFYTDWCDGKFWAAEPNQSASWDSYNLGTLIGSFTVTGMGEGDDGELYIMGGESLYQLVGIPLPDLIFADDFEQAK